MSNTQTNSPRILVVDDEPGMREGCRRALARQGFDVDMAEDIATGTELLNQSTYHICLLDVMLPDGNGLDLIDHILEMDPLTICIMITGFGSIDMAVTAVRRGAHDFLSKPFTSDELVLAVSQGLEYRRLRDIEAQNAALAKEKEDLERLDEVKSQLMLKVAHQLRAPAAAVQSYVTLILGEYLTNEEMQPTLQRMYNRLQEMLDLISDLLELANLKQVKDWPREELSPQPAAIILREVLDLLKQQAQEKNLIIETDISGEPQVIAVREHLRDVWTNLISNAIKYTPQGGSVKIELSVEAGNLLCAVKDSGIGISEQDMEHLFYEFFRSDEAKATGEMGTGLGLSIVKEILDSYGGEIKVSSSLGQGSTFAFKWPLSGPQEPRGQSTAIDHRPITPVSTRRLTPFRRQPRTGTHTRAFVLGEDLES